MILLSSFGLCFPLIAEKAKEHIKPENMKVLLIPFAGFHDGKTAAREINKGLLPFGFDIDNIYTLYVEEPDIYKDVKFDLVYVPGGNPFKLLYEAQKCDLYSWISRLVQEEGCSYFGISSGADFACENIAYLQLVDECNYQLKDYNGLGLIKEKVLCHVDQRDMATLQLVKQYDDRKTIFLRNDELYVIQ